MAAYIARPATPIRSTELVPSTGPIAEQATASDAPLGVVALLEFIGVDHQQPELRGRSGKLGEHSLQRSPFSLLHSFGRILARNEGEAWNSVGGIH